MKAMLYLKDEEKPVSVLDDVQIIGLNDNHKNAPTRISYKSQRLNASKTMIELHRHDKMTVKRLRFEDLLQDQAAQDGGDEALGQLDASFTLMMLTFTDFLPALFEAFGGEEVPEGI